MTEDQYVESVLAKYAVPSGPTSPAEKVGAAVATPLLNWAGAYLDKLEYSGSYAKGTAVRGASDVDILISVKSGTPGSLKEMYESLLAFSNARGWAPTRQNVSIGVNVGGTRADLVPARLHPRSRTYHSLYVRKRDSWTQTSIAEHIRVVRESTRTREIRAIKIWRLLRRLDFPSLFLELMVIQALKGRATSGLGRNVVHALDTISRNVESGRVMDPANTNNVLSDDLSRAEKARIAQVAKDTANERYWKDIIW